MNTGARNKVTNFPISFTSLNYGLITCTVAGANICFVTNVESKNIGSFISYQFHTANNAAADHIFNYLAIGY